MQVVCKRWLRALLLTSVYLLGTLGIVASGGGSGGEGDIEEFSIVQPVSPTLETTITLEVSVSVTINEPNSEYFVPFNFDWKNETTGESGTGGGAVSRTCSFPPPFFLPVCSGGSTAIVPVQIQLAVGSNEITIEVEGEKKSVHIVRIDDTIPPRMPTGVSVQTTENGAIVSWVHLIEATSYNIYFASSPGVTKTNYSALPDGTRITGASSPQSITGLTNGTVYYFVVTAVNAYGESAESIESMTTEPGVPTGVSAIASDGVADITWNPVIGANSYNIYFASSSGITKTNYSTLPDGTKLSDVSSPHSISGLTNGITFYVVVTAVNWLGESTESQESAVTPLSTTGPIAVEGSVTNGQATVSWAPVSFASSYNLYLATVSGVNKTNYTSIANGQKISDVSNPHVITGLINEQKYHIAVTQVNALGESDESLELVLIPGTSGWSWQNPLPGGGTIHDVEFADSVNGWVIGDGGRISKTNNGGNDWSSRWAKASNVFTNISVIDESSVWVIGHNNVDLNVIGTDPGDKGYFLMSTADGGDSWTFHAAPPGIEINDLGFVSASTGWIVGTTGIYFTDDGGNSWSQKSNLNGIYVDVIDLNNAKVVSDGEVFYSTNDGGETWLPLANLPSNVNGIDFTDTTNGWLVTINNGLYSTADGGNSWTMQNTNVSQHRAVSFSDPSNGWAVTRSGAIVHTDSGGINWTEQLSGVTDPLAAVYAVDALAAWAVGYGGNIINTIDGGNSWSNQIVDEMSTLDGLSSIDFVDSSNGWVAGKGIAHTSDGGMSWVIQTSLASNLYDIDFINATRGWAVGDGGQILFTPDGGNNWVSQDSKTSNQLRGVSFSDMTNGWTVDEGHIRNTTDGGLTWHVQHGPTLMYWRDIQFVNSTTGWAVGWRTIFHTNDGGITWNEQLYNEFSFAYCLFALNSTTAWVLGETGNGSNSVILKTTDGGNTWGRQNGSIRDSFRSIYFTDSLNGWAGTETGAMYVTQDGGATWSKQSSRSNSIRDIKFIDTTTGWSVGGEYAPQVLKSISGGFGP
jgi:photosystem II stability/assembly factor-like uncharacterized protein